MDTPILLITFNRPTHCARVLSAIREKRPASLYIFQDGPRTGNAEDAVKCQEVRKVIDRLVDWDCELNTFFAERNLGCGAGPMTGIGWFFNKVKEGIVMEDDCLPHPDFFEYCEELLKRFRSDDSVRFINATLYDNRWTCEASYGFSHYMVTGAWAGWKRTWQGFDLDLKSMDALSFRKHILKLTGNRGEANWWYSIVKEIQHDNGKKSYWDYQMQIHLFNSSALTIHPQVNLVCNIGFDGAGTHTLNNDNHRGNRPVSPILPLTHPSYRTVDLERDMLCWAKARSKGWLKDTISFIYESWLWSDGIGHKLLMTYKRFRGKGINSRKT